MRYVLFPLLLALAACGRDQPEAEAAPAEDPAGTSVALQSGGVTYRFAGPEEAAAVLTAEDAYTEVLQPREVAIRAGSAEASGFADLGPLYAGDVMAWSEEEKERMRQALRSLSETTETIAPLLPEEVLLVLAGDVVEGGLPHTRDNAVVFAGGELPYSPAMLRGLILHELHHVLSRHNPEVMDAYFSIVGYEPCAFEEPGGLRSVRLSNPDAPVNGHYVPASVDGADGVMPFLYTERAYDGEGRLPDYFGFGLVKVAVEDGRCTALAEGPQDLLDPQSVQAFFQAIGRNTNYIIHPEETLADNFTYWAQDQTDRPNPEIIEEVGAFWTALAEDAAE